MESSKGPSKEHKMGSNKEAPIEREMELNKELPLASTIESTSEPPMVPFLEPMGCGRIKTNPQIRLTSRVIQLALVCELIFAIAYYLIPAIKMMVYGGIWWNFVGYNLIISLLAITVFIYFGILHPDGWLAPLFCVLMGAALVVETYSEFIKEYAGLWAFFEITLVLIIFCIIIIYALLTAFIHWGLLAYEGIKNLLKKSRRRVHKTKKQIVYSALALIVILGSSVYIGLVLAGYQISAGTVTITPKEEPMELAFWAQLNPDRYTEEQKVALNKHSVLLIPYDTPIWDDASPQGRATFVSQCNYWKDNYPNVRIMAVAHGIPGGFVWDGSAEGTIAFCHRILQTCIDEDLTNVIGINTDQEKPHNVDLEEAYKDRERNQNATDLWNSFFEEVREMYGARFEYQTTFSMPSIIDAYDGDNDLDVYVRNNVLTVPDWDEYAPMIYTAGGKNYHSEPLSADRGHAELYFQMSILYDVLTRMGMPEKIGVYIGITNMSIMGADNQVYWHDRPQATGYDTLVTQALIAKHFGCRRLTTFILDTVPSGKEGQLMGGVFDSYGDDFLDRYNQSLNGHESTNSFDILQYTTNRRVGDLSKDFVFTQGIGYSMFAIAIGGYLFLVLMQRKKFKMQVINS